MRARDRLQALVHAALAEADFVLPARKKPAFLPDVDERLGRGLRLPYSPSREYGCRCERAEHGSAVEQ